MKLMKEKKCLAPQMYIGFVPSLVRKMRGWRNCGIYNGEVKAISSQPSTLRGVCINIIHGLAWYETIYRLTGLFNIKT